MISKKLLVAVLLLLTQTIYAATEAGVSLFRFAPTENFKDHIDRSYGLDVYGAWQPDDSFFGIGGYFQYIPFDQNTESQRISETGALSRFAVDVETQSKIFNLGFLFQVLPFKKHAIQPYLEGQAGIINIRTDSSAVSQEGDDTPVFTSTNSSDTSFIYGYTLGIKIRLFDQGKKESKKTLRRRRRSVYNSTVATVFLDLKYRRFFSNSKSEFILPSSITRGSAPEDWTRIQEKTSYETFHLGLSALF